MPAAQHEERTAERIARNQATFRAANEKIRDAATEHDVNERIPFICECANPRCTEAILLPPVEYEQIRSEATHFLAAPGHQAASAEWGRVVADHRDYVVVEKMGRAGEVAAASDDS